MMYLNYTANKKYLNVSYTTNQKGMDKMDCMIFVILTDEHIGLNESLTIANHMQIKGELALLTYELSHYRRLPLGRKGADSIKDIIESMTKHYDSVKVNIIADEKQVISIKKHFTNTKYDISAYVMRDKIDLSE